MSSRLRRAARSCGTASPFLVPLVLTGVLVVARPPWPVSVAVLAGGVVFVARRRGLEPGAYTALLSSAALAAVRARQAGTGAGASGRLLVGSTAAFLCCALVTDRRRPRYVSRLDEPAPVSPYEPADGGLDTSTPPISTRS